MTEKKLTVLRTEQLKAFYVLDVYGTQKVSKAVNNVDLEIYEDEIYGIAGGGATTQVFSYNLKSGDMVLYGPAYDAERKTGIFRPHELVMGPDRCLYCPETDNPQRQCYFWETELR